MPSFASGRSIGPFTDSLADGSSYQQGGPEPLDAYRRFLEERKAQGDFHILSKDLEAAFWRYYLTDAIHSFYPPGSKEEAEAFESPLPFTR